MAVPRDDDFTVYTAMQLTGEAETINSVAITGLMADGSGNLLMATGVTVPTAGSSGFAKGCLFIDTDVATGTTGLNCNKGTTSSCFFTAVTQA